MNIHTRISPAWIASIGALVLMMVCGCGDVDDGDGLSSFDDLSHLEPATLSGMVAIVARQSASCTPRSRVELRATVSDDLDFRAEEVRALEAPCPLVPAPATEIDFASDSLILDFRYVGEPGVYPSSDFEGYEIILLRECGEPVIAAHAIDRGASTLEIADEHVYTHMDRVRVNLAGMAYDHDSFLKIDLKIVELACRSTP